MRTSESTKDISAALAKAQAEMGKIVRDKTARVQTKAGGSYSFDYADLASVLDVVKPALAKNGIAVIQAAGLDGDKVVVETRLNHLSGEWIESSLAVKPEDVAPQKIGSAITYARRYALSCMVGVASEEDDDGNAAEGNQAQTQTRKNGKTPDQRQAEVDRFREQLRDPKARKAAVLKWFAREHGEVGMRPKIESLLGRAIPKDQAEIELHNVAELEKLEQYRHQAEALAPENAN